MGCDCITFALGVVGNEQDKLSDEIVDFSTSTRKNFYILKDLRDLEGPEARIRLKNPKQYFPSEGLSQQWLDNVGKEPIFIEVEGDYYPDYLEERGLYLFSKQFFQYYKVKMDIRHYEIKKVGLASQNGKRVEEYVLVLPHELDCILDGTAQFDKSGHLIYFEIDEAKTGELQIFRVKGFPHLIVVDKLNRLDFSGFQCTRIENYFDYEDERDRRYRGRLSGRCLENAIIAFQQLAELHANRVCYNMCRMLNREQLSTELGQGFKAILESHRGISLGVERLADRFLLFFYSYERKQIELAKCYQTQFEKMGFELKCLCTMEQFAAALPSALQLAWQNLCYEAVLHYAIVQMKQLDRYEGIHEKKRFRVYLQGDPIQSLNPPLIYDYKSPFQREVEAAEDLTRYDLSNQDLREFDLGGKSLTGVKIEGSDLRRARFTGANLAKAELLGCNLMGANYQKCNLREAKICECEMDRTCFDGADLRGAQFLGGRLKHASFLKANLTEAKVAVDAFTLCYFYNTRFFDGAIEIAEVMSDNVFRLCDFRGAKFIASAAEGGRITYCDFRNSDLTGCQFHVEKVVYSAFIKSRLSHADFSHCQYLSDCDFRWIVAVGTVFPSQIYLCDFAFANLSQIRDKKWRDLRGNNFFYANLSEFDLSEAYMDDNQFIFTNLADCNLAKARFEVGELIFPDINGANLTGARIRESQLEFVELSAQHRREVQIVSDPPEPDDAESDLELGD